MPNTTPKPILTARDAQEYREEIMMRVEEIGYDWFTPLMTIQITDDTTTEIIRDAKKSGVVVAGKIYPKGVTTNSHNGVTDFEKLYPVFEEMQKVDLVLSLHGQAPDAFCLDREKMFLATLIKIAKDFPNLRIVLEHISTKEALDTVVGLPNKVAATVTAHHLLLTLHDVLSHVGPEGNEGLNPHHYCQPVLQRPEDREALRDKVINFHTDRKIFLGSDSAPHYRNKKESPCGCAGVFSAPALLPVLAEVFCASAHRQTHPANLTTSLEMFTSSWGARFYGLPLNEGTATLVKKPVVMKEDYDGVVPLRAGMELQWQVCNE